MTWLPRVTAKRSPRPVPQHRQRRIKKDSAVGSPAKQDQVSHETWRAESSEEQKLPGSDCWKEGAA